MDSIVNSPQRWERAKEVFGDALDLPPELREAFVRAEAGADTELAEAVLGLLKQHETPNAMLDARHAHANVIRELMPHATDHSLSVGDVIGGRFRIQKFLGEGGMGQVYQAEDLELHCRVALKTLRPMLATNERILSRFRMEIHLSRRVTHPNVCRIFDLGRDDRSGEAPIVFLTMELLEGETLSARIRRDGALDVNLAMDFASQIARGLDAAHAVGVIHRDFKTSNVMVMPAGEGWRVAVTDFGLARTITPLSAELTYSTGTEIVGTPAFMAPEQIEGGVVDKQADIYALGVVLYEMITGRQPFTGPSPLAMVAQKMKGLPDAPGVVLPGVDAHWDSVIMRCLAFDPAERFQSAGDAVASLDTRSALPKVVLAAKPVVVSRRMLVAGSLTGLGAGVGGLWWWWVPDSKPNIAAASLYEQGLTAMAENTFSKAQRFLEAAEAADPGFLLAKARLGEVYEVLDFGEKAQSKMLQVSGMRQMARQSSDDNLILDAIHNAVLHDYAKAAESYRKLGDSLNGPKKVRALLDEGRAWWAASKRREAEKAHRQVIELDPQNAAGHLQLGRLAEKLEDARTEFAKAENSFRLQENAEGLTEVQLQRTERMINGAGYKDAEAEAERAVASARKEQGDPQRMRALLLLARIKVLRGEVEGAKAIVTRVLNGEGRPNSYTAQAFLDLGSAWIAQDNTEEAERYFLQAMQLGEQIDAPQKVAMAQAMLANVYRADPAKAFPLLDRAAEYYWRTQKMIPYCDTNALIASRRIDAGEYDKAYEIARKVEAIATERGYEVQWLNAQGSINHVLLVRGAFPESVENARSRIARFEKLGDSRRAITTRVTGAMTCVNLGRVAAAQTWLDQAMQLAKLDQKNGAARIPEIVLAMANLAQSAGDYGEASKQIDRAIALHADPHEIQRIQALVFAYTGNVQKSRELITGVLDKAKQKKNVGPLLQLYLDASEVYLRNHDFASAERLAADATALAQEGQFKVQLFRAALLKRAIVLTRDPKAARNELDELVVKALRDLTVTWSEADKASMLRMQAVKRIWR